MSLLFLSAFFVLIFTLGRLDFLSSFSILLSRVTNLDIFLSTNSFRAFAPSCLLSSAVQSPSTLFFGQFLASAYDQLASCGLAFENANTSHFTLADIIFDFGVVGIASYLSVIFMSCRFLFVI